MSRSIVNDILRFLLYFTFVRHALAACYLPNGTEQIDEGIEPCSFDLNNPLHTTCCHTRWNNPPGGDVRNGPTQDTCLPNGLCENRGRSNIEGEEQAPWLRYYRVSCTDTDWRRGGCLDVCSTGLNAHDGIQLTPCDGTASSEKWCCGDTTDCCADGKEYKAVFIPKTLSEAVFERPVVSSPSKGLSSDAKIGIGIGVPICAAIFFMMGLILPRPRKIQELQIPFRKTPRPEEMSADGTMSVHQLHGTSEIQELDNRSFKETDTARNYPVEVP